MAYIGLRYPVCAQLDTEADGQAITYKAGMIVGKAIAANLTLQRAQSKLYADDVAAEAENSLLGGTIEFTADDISDAVRAYMLSDVAKTEGSGSDTRTEYETTGDTAPYVGFGYMRVRRQGTSQTYEAVWYHKVMFSQDSENAKTKGEQIEWGTPTISGELLAVYNDATGKPNLRRRATFDTEAAAKAWLNTKAGIVA